MGAGRSPRASGPPGPPASPGSPRMLRAPNPSPLTLDGTRTYLIGWERVAVVDPGPDLPPHLDAIVAAVRGDRAHPGERAAVILLTHNHPDHAAGAPALARRLCAPVLSLAAGTLRSGQRVETDAGELSAVATPGHTPDHVAFHWPEAGAVFCGDLLLGGQESALVAPPEGDLTSYLRSLERIAELEPRMLYPAHGEPFTDAAAAIERYRRHRQAREAAVLAALAGGPVSADTVLTHVYGAALDPVLRSAAAGATLAYLGHLERLGRVRRTGGRWSLA